MNKKLRLLLGIAGFAAVMGGSLWAYNTFRDAGYTPEPVSTPPPAADLPDDSEPEPVVAPDFTVLDAQGNEVTLESRLGKPVVINFWASWCPPCKAEMPDIQALYEDWDKNGGDLVILGVAQPNEDGNAWNKEGDTQAVTQFLEENGYAYPVVMDVDGSIFATYGVQALPTTYMISSDGSVFGYAAGGLTRDIMDSIIDQTISGERLTPN